MIVVILLAILAAVAQSTFRNTAQSIKSTALRGTIHTLRTSIALYFTQHGATWPGSDGNPDTLYDQLTLKTDPSGNTGTTPGVHIYGPYMPRREPELPAGPNAGATGTIMTTLSPPALAIDESQSDKGWVYNYQTGRVAANTDDPDENGVGYDNY